MQCVKNSETRDSQTRVNWDFAKITCLSNLNHVQQDLPRSRLERELEKKKKKSGNENEEKNPIYILGQYEGK